MGEVIPFPASRARKPRPEDDCPRTHALLYPGVKLQGVSHRFDMRDPTRCTICGEVFPELRIT